MVPVLGQVCAAAARRSLSCSVQRRLCHTKVLRLTVHVCDFSAVPEGWAGGEAEPFILQNPKTKATGKPQKDGKEMSNARRVAEQRTWAESEGGSER